VPPFTYIHMMAPPHLVPPFTYIHMILAILFRPFGFIAPKHF